MNSIVSLGVPSKHAGIAEQVFFFVSFLYHYIIFSFVTQSLSQVLGHIQGDGSSLTALGLAEVPAFIYIDNIMLENKHEHNNIFAEYTKFCCAAPAATARKPRQFAHGAHIRVNKHEPSLYISAGFFPANLMMLAIVIRSLISLLSPVIATSF